jgi:hypothetical protein
MVWNLEDAPLPPLDPAHPRLERLLARIIPQWAAHRAAARRAWHAYAVRVRITAANDAQRRAREPEALPSRYGHAWRGSRYWTR